MIRTFEEYLQDIYTKSYQGLDDNMPDAFEAWLADMDKMEYADMFADEVVAEERERIANAIEAVLDQTK